LRGRRDDRFASGVELLQAMRAISGTADAVTARPDFVRNAWWWKFHQVAVATLTIVNTATLGFHKSYLGRSGSWVFLVVLVLATITTTLRLHLWFVSQVHPASLLALRARVLRWIVLCESLLLAALFAIGIAVSDPHDATAALFVVTALLLLLSLIVIEPATTRAALS
jgi:hypothetical protein